MLIEYIEGNEGNGGHYQCTIDGKSVAKVVDTHSGLHALWLHLGSPTDFTLIRDPDTGIVTKSYKQE